MSLRVKFLESQLTKEQLQEIEATINLLDMLRDDEGKLKDVDYGWFKTKEDPPVRVTVSFGDKSLVVFARGNLYTIQHDDIVVNNRSLEQVKLYLEEHLV